MTRRGRPTRQSARLCPSSLSGRYAIVPAGTKAVKLSGRSLRLWLGDLEASIWKQPPIAYSVHGSDGRVLLTPLASMAPLASPGVIVLARGKSARRYVYLGSCRVLLEDAGISVADGSWVRLVYGTDGILLSATRVSSGNSLVCQVQRLRGDGRLWLGCLATLGVSYRRYLVSRDRRGILLFPTPLAMTTGMLELRGRDRGRYVYFTGAHLRSLLRAAGLLSRDGAWVLVEVSMQVITVRAAWGQGGASTRRSRS